MEIAETDTEHFSFPGAAQHPLFSIIIPTFNSGNTLSGALNSLSIQNFRNFEVIFVDGASGDDTLRIIEDFRRKESDLNITIISEKDNGIYDAMNKGIRTSSGKYIYFLGSDDRLDNEGTLESVSACIAENPDIDIVYGDIRFVYSTPGVRNLDIRQAMYRSAYLSFFHRVGVFLGLHLNHQTLFARRDLLSEGFSLDYRLASDYDWYLRQKKGKKSIKYINEYIAGYNISGASSDVAPLVSEVVRIASRHLFSSLFPKQKAMSMRLRSLARHGSLKSKSLKSKSQKL